MKVQFAAALALMLALASPAFADGPNGGHGGAGRPTGNKITSESARLLEVGHGGSGRSDRSGGTTNRTDAGHGGSG